MDNTADKMSSRLVRQILIWLGPPLLVIVALSGLSTGQIPAGVPGEWTWNAPATGITMLEIIPAVITTIGLIAFSSISVGFLESKSKRAIAVALLFPVTAAVQAGWQIAAPQGYGLAKWPIATYNSGSSGYFSKARDEIGNLAEFLSDYPKWIKEQDVLHTGTHPPGLFVEARLILDFWKSRPTEASAWMAKLPEELREAARAAKPGGTPVAEQASVVSLAIVRWLASALTVWPLWIIMRRLGNSPLTSYRTALLWCVVPSAILFQPSSDLLFPVLSCCALALCLTSKISPGWRTRSLEPTLAGVVLAVGMFFSLVFLAVGAIVAIVVLTADDSDSLRRKCTRIGWIGIGFLGATAFWAIVFRTDPLAIWLENQAKHAGFYQAYPRSYWPWIAADFVETVLGLGLPVSLSAAITISCSVMRRGELRRHRVALATISILAILAFSGRNLSEVGRLWLPFFPLLLTSAMPDTEETQISRPAFLWMLLWSGIQIVWLQTLVQCVYPI